MKKLKYFIYFIILVAATTILLMGGFHSIKIKIGAAMSMRKNDSLERVLNIRPNFDYVSKGWSPMFKQNMTGAWKSLNIKGINYFLLGHPGFFKTYVSRADLNSKFYQAWFGTYVIDAQRQVFSVPNEKINESPLEGIVEYGKLAEHDQIAWLKAMGDTIPFASLIQFSPLTSITIDGNNVQLFEGVIKSHSDLSSIKTKLNKILGLPSKSKWDKYVDPFHDILLKGIYGIWYNPDDKTIKVVYACGSIVKFKDGISIDHYSKIKNDMIKMLGSINYKKLNN